MADLFVKFPGTTDHISTDDANHMDADTAHLEQSIGLWENSTGAATLQQSTDKPPVFGDYVLSWVSSAGGTCSITAGDDAAPAVVPGQTISVSYDLWMPAARGVVELRVRHYDSGGAYLGSVVVADSTTYPIDERFNLSGTYVVPVNAIAGSLNIRITLTDAGDVFYASGMCLREGSDPTFVPSLRIVGTLFETIDPVDMPIVFAADGTPLTVGEGWAGYGYRYTRYDGPDDTAPVVCDFNPADLP